MANWQQGIANLMDFIGQYAGNYGLTKQREGAAQRLSEAKMQQQLTMDPLEYSVWTDPENPMRKDMEQKWQKKYPGFKFPTMTSVRPEQFLRLKAPGLGGGLNLFGVGGGVVNVDE